MRGIISVWLCFIGMTAFAQENVPQPSGRISLEEVELTIRQGGKVREQKRQSQDDEHEMRKKLKPGEQVESRRLKKPKLRFLDAQGRAKKELELGDEVEVATMTSTGPSKMKISRRARVARTGKSAVVIESIGEQGEGRETGSVNYVSENGETLWQKKLPRFRAVSNSKISADGNVFVAVEYWTKLFGLPTDQPTWQLVVYSRTGSELVAFPKLRSEGVRVFSGTGDFQISPDGKYVAVRIIKGKDERVAFLNSASGRIRIHDKAAFPIDIDAAGKARIGIVPGTEIEVVELRNILE